MKSDDDHADRGGVVDGPRAVLRVPEVLMALAIRGGGASLTELSQQLGLPKTSLHRLLRTLEQGGYLAHQGSVYVLASESFRLAALVGQARRPVEFPACARPVVEWLARETGETVTLNILSEQENEIIYVDVIESDSPLRFTVRIGNRRPLFCVAAGKAMLAFSAEEKQIRYIERTEFLAFTPETTRKEEMPAILREARGRGIAFDRNGIVEGASALASPAFDREGEVFCAIAVAGPTERIETRRARIEPLVREAGERISRILGYGGVYPPPEE